MDYKLKAISNNVDNDQIDLIILNKQINQNIDRAGSSHLCKKQIPVIFSTEHGIHMRTFKSNSSNNYLITFCDLERWVSN